jgi:RNA polymerase sigma factor (sigma-70 family)
VGLVEDREEARSLLKLLSHRQRAVLVLTGYLRFTTTEVAEVLGVTEATVRSTASQARAAVRRTQELSDD